jgi:hypothetical protein
MLLFYNECYPGDHGNWQAIGQTSSDLVDEKVLPLLLRGDETKPFCSIEPLYCALLSLLRLLLPHLINAAKGA